MTDNSAPKPDATDAEDADANEADDTTHADDTTQDHASSRARGWRGRRRERRKKRSGLVQWLIELPIMLVVAFVVALLMKTFVVQAFWIPSGSMEQTLHGCPGCTGDRILVNRMSYWFSDPEPGDIVVFEAGPTWDPEVHVDEPDDIFGQSWLWIKRTVGAAPPAEKDLVKRVIAVGGQTIECCDAQQRVLVDGKPLDEPYIYVGDAQTQDGSPYQQMPFGPITVPEGRLFVMGDHRNGSADSRFHVDDQYQGTISIDQVVGRAFIIIYPFDRFGWLTSPDLQGAQALAADPSPALAAPHLLAMLVIMPFASISLRRRREPL